MAFVKVRQDGSITIPKEIRRQGQFIHGAWVSVQPTAGGNLMLTPQALNCSVCGKRVPTLDRQTNICPKCVALIIKNVNAGIPWSDAIRNTKEYRTGVR